MVAIDPVEHPLAKIKNAAAFTGKLQLATPAGARTATANRLAELPDAAVRQVRGRGLWAGVEFVSLPGREACEQLAERGILAKDTHGSTIRLAPPLVIEEADLDWALDCIADIAR